MKTATSPAFFATLKAALRASLPWRVVLMWLIGLALLTSLAALPFWRIVAHELDNSIKGSALAHGIHTVAFVDLLARYMQSGIAVNTMTLLGVLLNLALTPFAHGLYVVAYREPTSKSFSALIQGAIKEYWRMFRLQMWSLVPLGLGLGVIGGVSTGLSKYGEKLIVESDIDLPSAIGYLLAFLVFALLHSSADAARGLITFDHRVNSVIKAWWRSVKIVLSRPIWTIGMYAVVTLFGAAGLLACVAIRLILPTGTAPGFIAGVLLGELIALCSIFMFGARSFAMMRLHAHVYRLGHPYLKQETSSSTSAFA